MACQECCFTDYVSCDIDSIQMNAKLQPTTNYIYSVVDRFGNIYRKQFTTDGDGYWSLSKADFPQGFFGHGNRFTVSVTDVDGNKKSMAIQSHNDCIEVNTTNISGVAKTEIGLNV